MNKLWRAVGIAGFWASWPLLILYLNRGERTRILIVHRTEILVVRGWLGNGKWVLPGGGLRKNEQPLDGVLRELQEETGVTLSTKQPKLLMKNMYRDIGFRFPCQYFVVELAQKPATRRQKFEISALAWVDYRQLDKTNANKDVLEACAAWFGK